MCHSLARDQPQPGSFFQRPGEAEKRDPGNDVAGDIELNPGSEDSNRQNKLSLSSTILLNYRLCQLRLRPVNVGGAMTVILEPILVTQVVTFTLDKFYIRQIKSNIRGLRLFFVHARVMLNISSILSGLTSYV